jgi:uncharacterized lipoprotein YmbA
MRRLCVVVVVLLAGCGASADDAQHWSLKCRTQGGATTTHPATARPIFASDVWHLGHYWEETTPLYRQQVGETCWASNR